MMDHSTNAEVVSCIIPAYNAESYVRECIDSVFAQTYRDIEIIVVDDGSTDDTCGMLASYGHAVKYLRQPNSGPAAARNRGINQASGAFIAFLDADDVWHPEKLERQRRHLDSKQELGYCVTCCQNFWAPELTEEAKKYQDHRISQPMPGYVTGTLLARRCVFETVGLFNSQLGHGDSTDWFLRARESRVAGALLPEVLMYRRLHSTNRSRAMAAHSREEFLQLLKDDLDRRRKNGTTPYHQNQ